MKINMHMIDQISQLLWIPQGSTEIVVAVGSYTEPNNLDFRPDQHGLPRNNQL